MIFSNIPDSNMKMKNYSLKPAILFLSLFTEASELGSNKL